MAKLPVDGLVRVPNALQKRRELLSEHLAAHVLIERVESVQFQVAPVAQNSKSAFQVQRYVGCGITAIGIGSDPSPMFAWNGPDTKELLDR